MYLDVSPNTGPVKTREIIEHRKSLSPATRSINYTRSTLFSLKKSAPFWLPSQLVTVLKDMSILRTRGCRAELYSRERLIKNQIPVNISPCKQTRSRFVYANYMHQRGVNTSNLITIPTVKSGPTARKNIPKCMVINARSLAKPDAAPALYAELHSKKVDICFVSETLLNKNIPSHMICPDGYIYYYEKIVLTCGLEVESL